MIFFNRKGLIYSLVAVLYNDIIKRGSIRST